MGIAFQNIFELLRMIASLVPILLPFFIPYLINEIKLIRKRFRFIVSYPKIKKILASVEDYDNTFKKYLVLFSVIFVSISFIFTIILNFNYSILGFPITITIFSIPLFIIFTGFLSVGPNENLVYSYEIFRGFVYSVMITGIFTARIFINESPLLVMLVCLFYLPAFFDYFGCLQIRQFKRNKIKEKLKRNNYKNSPKITVFTTKEVSGKIKDLFDEDFLILRKGSKDIVIMWKEIKWIKI